MYQVKKYLRKAFIRSFLGPHLKEQEARKFRRQFDAFSQLAASAAPRLPLRWEDVEPILGEDTPGHSFDRHYVYHTAWAARKVREIAPTTHVDISSSLYFAGIVSAFVPVRFYDFRRAPLELDNLSCDQADLLSLPFPDGTVPSLSCMHVVEHIGLGRYGDPLNPQGDLLAMRELARVLASGGSLLLVVPVGQPRVCFNSHRIYGYEHVLQSFPRLELIEFSLIPDSKQQPLLTHADPVLVACQEYACGCFWFKKA
ncbi:MAG: DUF268 domain-containing protein [Anaerolineales bacterium]|jgi:SAM-dependent methyltransferase|nr:DUF268 domain-containing protein [Anaerolineales bacterium]